ncbi:hypothetical protein E1B28_005144 [Marasmius oreades]|uniref:Nephrocystin 3-like N-terminal domain-containing protein n=1 Tax=Marasmius oreades TaxID=181124 RepID=A0A9P8ADI5_9AGAR|nr:uncharacterized protein E1B28_005144 [Marasmius oreades]KAG7097826.1 hypothetical protein E1B28_005144 [Marasmius oreades]
MPSKFNLDRGTAESQPPRVWRRIRRHLARRFDMVSNMITKSNLDHSTASQPQWAFNQPQVYLSSASTPELVHNDISSPWLPEHNPDFSSIYSPRPSRSSVGLVRSYEEPDEPNPLRAINTHTVNSLHLHEGGKFWEEAETTDLEGKGKPLLSYPPSARPKGTSGYDKQYGFIDAMNGPSLTNSMSAQLSRKTNRLLPKVPEGRPQRVIDNEQPGVSDDRNVPYSRPAAWGSHYLGSRPAVPGRPLDDEFTCDEERDHNPNYVEPVPQPSRYSPHSQYASQGTTSTIRNAESVQAFSGPIQHLRIGHAMFNNLSRGDQYNQNFYTRDLLWDTIADVGASHNSEIQVERGHCLPGTREIVLRLIHEWGVSGGRGPPVCWLSGAAGVGKSAIALTVAKEWEKDGLVTSFFFLRSDPKRNNPSSLILSIAHGLVVTRPYLRPAVNKRITDDPRVLKAKLEDQYNQLVLANLNNSCPPSTERSPDLIVIDGLDECSDAATQQRILSIVFSTYQQSLHSPLRFLICSRPESWIQESFESHKLSCLARHIKLDDGFKPEYDIELYFEKLFRDIREDPKYSHVQFPNRWPSPGDVRLLVRKADGQFIYASTIIKFIKTDFALPTNQLRIILDVISTKPSNSQSTHSPFNDLDELYCIVLRANPDHDKLLLPILATIHILNILPLKKDYLFPSDGLPDIPSSPAFIELLLGFSTGMVALTLRAMHSVLDVHGQQTDIRVYHKSFTDFLFDRARSREFSIDKSKWKYFLACRWTRVLTEQCRCNPELLRYGYDGDKAAGSDLQILVNQWNMFCLPADYNDAKSELLLELDSFYSTALASSILPKLGKDVLLHILASTLLHPSCGGLPTPRFIRLLLGLQRDDLAQQLGAMHKIIQTLGFIDKSSFNYYADDIFPLFHFTFLDFLFDKSRSNTFFIDRDYYCNFYAQRCLCVLQTSEGGENHMLLRNWSCICIAVDKPNEELLREIGRMDDLGDILDKNLLNTDLDDTDLDHSMLCLCRLFSGLGNIATWLRLKASDRPNLSSVIDRFESVQTGFDIRSTRQDVESGLHDDIVTMIILSTLSTDTWNWWFSCDSVITRLCNAKEYRSEEGHYLVKVKLSSVMFCGCSRIGCSTTSTFNLDSDRLTTPIPGAVDLYHINVKAGYVQVLERLVTELQSTEDIKEQEDIVDNILASPSSLLVRCVPRPELLPLCRTVLDIAKKLGRGDELNYRQRLYSKESQGRLLSWLESFPAEFAQEVGTLKNDIISLFGVDRTFHYYSIPIRR